MLIDDSRGAKAKAKAASSIYLSEKRGKVAKSGSKGKKSKSKAKGRPRFTAYMLWAKANRHQVLQEAPNMDFAAISKRLGDIWSNSVPMSEKWTWKRKANQLSLKTARQQQRLAQMEAAASAKKPAGHRNVSGTGRSLPQSSPTEMFKVNGTEPLDCAAHLKLLGESLSVIGKRLTEHEGQIAVSGSLSVLLDSLLCSMAPLLCLTQQIPEFNGVPEETLVQMLDNIAYIMPGL